MSSSSLTLHSLSDAYRTVRERSLSLTTSLETEDYVIQSMADVSPPKWHLGHTAWFFETLVLREFLPDYRLFHERFPFIFNSYYEHAGERLYRPHRGLMSRPTVREVRDYRKYVDEHMERLLENPELSSHPDEVRRRTILGLHHEEQHQELFLMDIKNIFYTNVLRPVFHESSQPSSTASLSSLSVENVSEGGTGAAAGQFLAYEGGLFDFGFAGEGFSYDNEGARHSYYLRDFQIMDRLVTNGEYREFIQDGGYQDFRHWLSDAWDVVRARGWQAPLYWEQVDDHWCVFALDGYYPVDPEEPVSHLSFYEAHAYAAWAGARLPLEYEWERVAQSILDGREGGPGADKTNSDSYYALNIPGNFMENCNFRPLGASKLDEQGSRGEKQYFGDLWEWTASPYTPYPDFEPLDGALGEYNGKFMNDQRVLRGGSYGTPAGHIRSTYRNFFQGDKRWAFSGLRLAK